MTTPGNTTLADITPDITAPDLDVLGALLERAKHGLTAPHPIISQLIDDEHNVEKWGLVGRLAAVRSGLEAMPSLLSALPWLIDRAREAGEAERLNETLRGQLDTFLAGQLAATEAKRAAEARISTLEGALKPFAEAAARASASHKTAFVYAADLDRARQALSTNGGGNG